jgi:FtsH-binding integral membrane protein
MKKILKFAVIIAVLGLIICVGLLLELSRHDPYSWANPPFGAVESRDLWNVRKDFYMLLARVFLASTVISSILFTIKFMFAERIKSR